MKFPRVLVNDNIISNEQMHCFDVSKGHFIIKVRFLHKTKKQTKAPLFNQDLKQNENYDDRLVKIR